MNKISYNRQFIDLSDVRAVSKSLQSEIITTGKFVKTLEDKISKLLKSNFVISCSNGTAGLHLAFMGIGIKKKDNILMPAINFIAAYNMCQLLGANIYLVDVDPLTGQMTPENLLKCIKKNNLKKIKAIVTMYLGGYPENIVEFYKIKKKYKCFLVEDACHAFGAKYLSKNKYYNVGSCAHSDICVFSLHPVKTITSGEGGLISTNQKNIAKKIFLLRSQGIERKKNHWEYDITKLGFNYRLSDINCALALSQLSKLNKFLKYRKKIYDYYAKELKDSVNLPNYNINNKPSFHLFLISINFSKIRSSKKKILKFLMKNKIYSQYHYIPIYRFSIFKKKINNFDFINAEYYYKNTISIPIYYNLSLESQKKIVNKIKFFLK
jgi:dTDP-4-amino-4,6-dideoxygalactose transaminase